MIILLYATYQLSSTYTVRSLFQTQPDTAWNELLLKVLWFNDYIYLVRVFEVIVKLLASGVQRHTLESFHSIWKFPSSSSIKCSIVISHDITVGECNVNSYGSATTLLLEIVSRCRNIEFSTSASFLTAHCIEIRKPNNSSGDLSYWMVKYPPALGISIDISVHASRWPPCTFLS